MAPLIAGAPLSPLVADVRSGQSHAHLSSSRHAPVLGRSHNKSHSHGYGREGLFQHGAPTGVFNVLHMISDDLGGGFLPNYGHKDVIAPNLLKLGQSGVTFDMAYTQWSQCAPSRASFMTGRRPHRTGVLDRAGSFRELGRDVHGVGDTWTTLPEHFKKNGFTTLGCGKTFHPNSPPHFDERSWSDDFPYFEFSYDLPCDMHQCCPGTGPPKDGPRVSKIDTWHAGGLKHRFTNGEPTENLDLPAPKAAWPPRRPWTRLNDQL